jgi:hypothetical protein
MALGHNDRDIRHFQITCKCICIVTFVTVAAYQKLGVAFTVCIAANCSRSFVY